MAPVALLVVGVGGIGAGGKDGLSLEQLLPIVAGAAMEAFAVGARGDAGGLRLHGKTDIDMAEPACVHGPVKPMIKHDRARSSRGVVENNLAILGRFGRRFGQIDLGGHDIPEE